MKKLAVFLAGSLVAASTFAAGNTLHDNCGCGIGRMALGDQEPSVLSQLAVTFLNGICGNQTFGITSGTLDCKPSSGIVSNARVQQFVAANMDHLVLDIAVGQGDSLNALADLMEVPSQQRPALYGNLQSHFNAIFPASNVSSPDVVRNLDKVING